MPTWAWVVIAVGAVLVVAAVAAGALARRRAARSERLRERFGPEYDRTLQESGDQKLAEAELEQRVERRQQLRIVPLGRQQRDRYAAQWRDVQAQFVDSPETAVASADRLVTDVMRERGYPVDDFEQRAADVSVDHPLVVDNYRSARAIAERSRTGEATTEDLRQAMRHYRALFDELLDDARDEPLLREADEAGADAAGRDAREVTR